MLVGIAPEPRKERDVVLDRMNQMPHSFHLTGSRFFENATKDSDIDFFVGDEPGAVNDLLSLGFYELKEKGHYKGSHAILVLEHKCGIHVQIVKDCGLHMQIQNAMKSSGIYRIIREGIHEKSYQKMLWNFCYLVASTKPQGV